VQYFLTGASGFIGKRLVKKILERDDSTVFFLIRESDKESLEHLYELWNCDSRRAIPVVGDLTQPLLGVSASDRKKLGKKTTHFFHLAAIYDLTADAESQLKVNVQGTRNTVQFAEAIGAKHFHLFSSIASAGLFEGLFREDMFEEAEGLEHPYFRTKHDSEGIVRRECSIPWRVYRPALVVGDSRTGEMDKIDGPYYFFKLIQKLRKMLPSWMPTIGIEGGRINVVPVDFIVNAVDHIAHLKGEDGKCFHLVDPTPMRVGDLLNTFARAAHAPEMSMRINAALFSFIPYRMRKSLMALTPVRRIRNAVMKDLGLPEDMFRFVNYPTRFDCRETTRALKGSIPMPGGSGTTGSAISIPISLSTAVCGARLEAGLSWLPVLPRVSARRPPGNWRRLVRMSSPLPETRSNWMRWQASSRRPDSSCIPMLAIWPTWLPPMR
jgi:thioester reductase-like protein